MDYRCFSQEAWPQQLRKFFWFSPKTTEDGPQLWMWLRNMTKDGLWSWLWLNQDYFSIDVQILTLCSTKHIPRQWNVINKSKIKVSMSSPSVILWCQTCYRYFAKYTRCISAGCVIPSIFPINYFLLCPKWRPTPRGKHYCPSHRMEQSKKYHNNVDSNFPSMMIFFTLGGLSRLFQIIFLFEPPRKYISVSFL